MNRHWFVACAVTGLMVQAGSAFSQEAILPQGVPGLRDRGEEKQQREDARDSRMKQQGQGPNYRVQGKSQGGAGGATEGAPQGSSRQETGLAHRSVNPGQATGMRVLRGEVKQAGIKSIVIEDRNGKQT